MDKRMKLGARSRSPLQSAIFGCVVAVSFAGAAAAQQPEIQFGKIDPAAGLSSDQVAHSAATAPVGAMPAAPPAPATPESPLKPHLGIDVGGSGATLDAIGRPAGLQNNSDPDRRYRAKAGIDYDVSSKVQLGLGYSYSNYERPDLVLAPAPDTELDSQQREQAAKLSLRYKFE